jgi:subfamily B ATP-binding cassette protein MsbA
MERGIELIEQIPAERGGTLAPARVHGDIELRAVGLRYAKTDMRGAGAIGRAGDERIGDGGDSVIEDDVEVIADGSGGRIGNGSESAATGGPGRESTIANGNGNGEQVAALADVTLSIRAGETVAFVGPSGAGKTSLVNLLPRFIEPTSGSVLLDGAPLTDYDIVALRGQFALVSQDVVLFNDTVAANVALGSDIDLARVRDALAGANLLDHVLTMPGGLDAHIGHNGMQLSGGQRQRLAIARAIYKDAPILILDEATSALDSESERAVQAALDVLMRGRTTLVIAHRLSTIEHADRVIAMDQGRIVESGPHAELLARGGLYARLHAMQFRG